MAYIPHERAKQEKQKEHAKTYHANLTYILTAKNRLSKQDISGLEGKGMTIMQLPEVLLERIFEEEYKDLLKTKLRDWIPYDKIDLKWLSANINIEAINILKDADPDNLDWKKLAANISAYEILSDPVNRVRLNKYKKELSDNSDKDVVKFLQDNKGLVNLKILSGNKGAGEWLLTYAQEPLLLDIKELSRNPGAINLIREFFSKDPYSPFINWNFLSENPKAIKLLEQNKPKINWSSLSKNPKAIELLRDKRIEENGLSSTVLGQLNQYQKIDWGNLSSNPKAIELLREKIEEEERLSPNELAILQYHQKIDWKLLSANPGAIKLLEEALTNDPDNSKINWDLLSANPKAIKLLKKYQGKINFKYLSMNPSIFVLDRWHTGSSPPPFAQKESSSSK